ncbi:uncharacterized protein LOC141722188 [Apium graveolens]|uniref:uncharacterized protein LOC141722188 n=1 Tax=Apium graveolens TaxID=4045 RepID=UPI003D7935DC
MCKRLPVFNDQPQTADDLEAEPFRVDVAFGFDCFSDDFKVLRIEYDAINHVQPVTVRGVYLYTLKSDMWKEIIVGVTLPSFVCYAFCPVLISGPVVDGVLYLEGMNEMVTFDLHNEVFGLIEFPSFVQRRKSNVFNFQGSVAVFAEELITDDDGSSSEIISLWTMAAASDKVFWNKAFTIDPGLEVDWVFEHFGAKQFLGRDKLGETVHDFGNKKTKAIEFPSQSFLVKALKHSESFLSIEGFKQIKED